VCVPCWKWKTLFIWDQQREEAAFNGHVSDPEERQVGHAAIAAAIEVVRGEAILDEHLDAFQAALTHPSETETLWRFGARWLSGCSRHTEAGADRVRALLLDARIARRLGQLQSKHELPSKVVESALGPLLGSDDLEVVDRGRQIAALVGATHLLPRDLVHWGVDPARVEDPGLEALVDWLDDLSGKRIDWLEVVRAALALAVHHGAPPAGQEALLRLFERYPRAKDTARLVHLGEIFAEAPGFSDRLEASFERTPNVGALWASFGRSNRRYEAGDESDAERHYAMAEAISKDKSLPRALRRAARLST